ncbi:MAG TPA: outer membrane beta-barrel protein, partial [Candidatus Baltobacteraceae bacterium]|nr:outer membrane beta-barrel protein [Candidatus Baltobacteraceae bacterium]
DVDVQRGVVWAAETTFSRGVRLAYTNGKWFGDLGYDDGFYSGNRGRALDGLAGWTPTPNTTWQFAFTLPGASTPGNVTATIANKREYDVMLTQQYGKLQLLPYVLFVQSPAAPSLGYGKTERATGYVVLADYALTSAYSVGLRFESFANASASNDVSLNADLVGFGPGSAATTWTITPSWHPGPFFARIDLSNVSIRNFTPGLGFGATGTSANQHRIIGELGVQF